MGQESPQKLPMSDPRSPSGPRSTTANGVLTCDYLVVGAGTAGMCFVDTMLTENPEATIVLVDRNDKPGGHWVHAYPFVRLHTTGCFYGVNSTPLGKHRRGKDGRYEQYDMYDRPTGAEVLDYFQRVCDRFVASGRVECVFRAEYRGCDDDDGAGIHEIVVAPEDDSSAPNNTILRVTCGKLVTVHTNVEVPSMRKKPTFPVDPSVNFVPVNQIPECIESGKFQKYMVFGNGKTGCDAIIHMLDHGIEPSHITWIVSRDVWYFLREGFTDFYGSFGAWGNSVLEADSVEDHFLRAEKLGCYGRLDPENRPFPEVIKGATIDQRELEALRSLPHVVRMGKAKAVMSNCVVLEEGSLDFDASDTLLVDCTGEGFYGYAKFPADFCIFEPHKINLGPAVGFYNLCYSYSHAAFVECALDTDDQKNDCCSFLRGEHCDPTPTSILGQLYTQNKTFAALSKVKGGSRFLLNSRTNQGAPFHHKGGMARFLWFLYGPAQGIRFGKKLVRKIESGGYAGLDHRFGVESLANTEVEA